MLRASYFAIAIAIAATATPSTIQPAERAIRECVKPADVGVWLVKTGSFWRAGGKFGHFRVVVRREGVEHAIDRAELQVLITNDKTQKREIATCTDLQTPGLKGYVEDITFHKIDDWVTAVGLDISMKTLNETVFREVILASYRGKVERLTDTPDSDLEEVTRRLGSQ